MSDWSNTQTVKTQSTHEHIDNDYISWQKTNDGLNADVEKADNAIKIFEICVASMRVEVTRTKRM